MADTKDSKSKSRAAELLKSAGALAALLLTGGAAGASGYTGPSSRGGILGNAGSILSGEGNAVANAVDALPDGSGFESIEFPVNRASSPGQNRGGHGAPEFLQEQTAEQHRKNMDTLAMYYLERNPLPSGLPPQVAAIEREKRLADAIEYAVRMEPKIYPQYITRKMDGVSPDGRPRQAQGQTWSGASSWVGAVRRTSPTTVDVYLGPSRNNPTGWYTYGGNAADVERFLRKESLGREVIAIKNGQGSSLQRL